MSWNYLTFREPIQCSRSSRGYFDESNISLKCIKKGQKVRVHKVLESIGSIESILSIESIRVNKSK